MSKNTKNFNFKIFKENIFLVIPKGAIEYSSPIRFVLTYILPVIEIRFLGNRMIVMAKQLHCGSRLSIQWFGFWIIGLLLTFLTPPTVKQFSQNLWV